MKFKINQKAIDTNFNKYLYIFLSIEDIGT